MRSVVVVLPASTWAMTPILRSCALLLWLREFLVMANQSFLRLHSVLRAAAAWLAVCQPRRDGFAFRLALNVLCAVAEARAHGTQAPAVANRGNQLVVSTHRGRKETGQKTKNPGGGACRGFGDRKAQSPPTRDRGAQLGDEQCLDHVGENFHRVELSSSRKKRASGTPTHVRNRLAAGFQLTALGMQFWTPSGPSPCHRHPAPAVVQLKSPPSG